MTSYKKFIFTVFLTIFVFSGLSVPQPANAFSDFIGGAAAWPKWIWERTEQVYDKVQGIVGAELSDRTVGMFLDSFAYDVASNLAEGGPGGKPLFTTDSLKKSFEKSGQQALGEFLGELTEKGFDELGINLCNPRLELKSTLLLGLIDQENPPKPKCEWTNLQNNWRRFGDNMQADLIKFQLDPRRSGSTSVSEYMKRIFSPDSTDLGTVFKLHTELNNRKLEAEKVYTLDKTECQGFLNTRTTITEEVVTHCSVHWGAANTLLANSFLAENLKQLAKKEEATAKSLGSILKDAGNKFLDTFSSKLMNNWIKKGMWSLFGNDDNDVYQEYRDTLLDRLRGGANIRQPRGADIFKDFKSVNIESLESFDYLSLYAICPDEFRQPDNCTISPAFLQAINSKLTIQQAIDKGIIKGDMPFVRQDDPLNHTINKCYRDSLCYGNLVKLRKANMIPVGWELAALRAPVSLQQAINCFEEEETCDFEIDRTPGNRFMVDGNFHNPYYHLIDPDWVMKAPDVRCEAYAYSSVLESPETSNRQKYCADLKVCLREDSEGNCIEDQFNYCTRSENTWNFDGKACNYGELYSGCLTFSNEDFGDNSYIEDSLEYCTADQAGCRRYSQNRDEEGNWILEDIDDDNNDLFLNAQTVDCKSNVAGCNEYIVMAPGTGANIVPNGSFDDLDGDGFPDGWFRGNTSNIESDGIDDPDGLVAVPGIPLDYDGDRVPNGYSYGEGGVSTTERVTIRVELQPNMTYKLSAAVSQIDPSRTVDQARIAVTMCDDFDDCSDDSPAKAVDNLGDCELGYGNHYNNATLLIRPAGTELERGACLFRTNEKVSYAYVNVGANSQAWVNWFDNIKLEVISDINSIVASNYSAYGNGAKIYTGDETIMCTVDEVGCQGYIPENGDPMIPAVITQDDLCPSQCVGYETFTEQITSFDIIENDLAVEYYNFIPETAQECPDQEIGCEEFTNLDVVAEGGEGREYFTYLRQCVEESRGTIYYTWEGTDVEGYQIKTWYALPQDVGDAPCTNMAPEGGACLDVDFIDDNIDTLNEVAACGPDTGDTFDNPDNNPNCRIFFDEGGNEHYRLQDRVIFATNNCHDYRRTLTGQIYRAVPDESITCSEANNGCRSYYGNNANNIRLVFADNFEDGTYAPWVGNSGSVDLSNVSLNNNGHSLKAETDESFSRDVMGLYLQNDKEYTISWWMKSDTTIEGVNVLLGGYDGSVNYSEMLIDSFFDSNFQNIEPGNWHYYTKSVHINNLNSLNTDLIENLSLNIATVSSIAGQGLYIDNFTIKEIENHFSVVRNSWDTPIECDQPYDAYHLGCQSYKDLNRQPFNLKSFDHLCREDAIGCLPVIDTHNSTNPFEEIFHPSCSDGVSLTELDCTGDGGTWVLEPSQIIVEADSLTYLVPDPDNYCPQTAKGCSALGEPDRLDETEFYSVYKINDPDKYNSILCDYAGLGCSEYNTAKGVFYLKDPGAETCTYQQNVLIEDNLLSGWFKTETLNDEVPLGCADTDGDYDTDGDGHYDLEEIVLANDYCSVSEIDPIQSFFFTKQDCEDNGGYWNNYLLAAQCPASENLCTSFRDPVDPINCDPKGKNLSFIDFDGYCNGAADDNESDCLLNAGEWIFPSLDGYCTNSDYNNKKDCEDEELIWTAYCKNYHYYYDSEIDESSCNGSVDRQEGCVLFYEANSWNGEHSQTIATYDTAETYEDIEVANRSTSPVVCDINFDPNCTLDSNKLIKVTKDRQCSEWLACKSSTASKDPNTEQYKIICDDLASCLEFQYDADSNTTRCKTWGSYDEGVEALTFEKYQSRDTGLRGHISWSDKEYTGYSIPNMLPVASLSVKDFGDSEDSFARLTYNITDTVVDEIPVFADCLDDDDEYLDGQACSETINTDGNYIFRGECQGGVCWVSPKVNAVGTSTYAIETRAYAIADAPFPSSINLEGTEERISKYKGANVCDDELNSCETEFKRAEYGKGQVTINYSVEAETPKGICTSGDPAKIGQDCEGHYINADCDSIDDGESRHDGICSLQTEEVVFRNWPGICLEYDEDNPLTKDGANSFYCNQWYPAQKIQGTASLYDNYRSAGYYEVGGKDALFCTVAEPYVTREDRYYCGYFTAVGDDGLCNVLLKIPAGSNINLDTAAQYVDLLNEGAWLTEAQANPTFNSSVGKEIISSNQPESKFLRYNFDNIYPTQVNFMGIIDQLFDASDTVSGEYIHRFYWDEDVAASGALSGSRYVNLPTTTRQHHSQCGDGCPSPTTCTGSNVHTVYQECHNTKHCGWHISRHRNIYCNPLTYNYYVDVNSGGVAYTSPSPVYEGSCGPDCKFISATSVYSKYGIGCLTNPTLSLLLSDLFELYEDDSLPSGFDESYCLSDFSPSSPVMCEFMNCISNLDIVDSGASHLCSSYDVCLDSIYQEDFPYNSKIEVALIANQIDNCFPVDAEEVGDLRIDQMYDEGQFSRCLAENTDDFTDYNGEINADALELFCLSCVRLEGAGVGAMLPGVECDGLECYQQCSIITQLDSEGELSAIRTDIWWRNKKDENRFRTVGPWQSWYWNDGYVISNEASIIGDEVLYGSIATFSGEGEGDDNYPEDFSHYGAGLDKFESNRIVSVRVPYYKISPDNLTAATFFAHAPLPADEATAYTDALVELGGLFHRAYNLEWMNGAGNYQASPVLVEELHETDGTNLEAGGEYSPRILAACGDQLCEELDVNGNVVAVLEGLTINNMTEGRVIGRNASLFVNLKFFYHAHPDHMPVTSISVDWGDEPGSIFVSNTGRYKNALPSKWCNSESDAPGDPHGDLSEPRSLGFSGTDEACQDGYKIFYHDYFYDETQTYRCDGTSGKPNIESASCYQPSIRIIDNWGVQATRAYSDWVVVRRGN